MREPGHRCSTPALDDTLCRLLPPAVPQRTIPVYGCAAATGGGCCAAHRCCRPSCVVAARGGGLSHHRLRDPPIADRRCRGGDCPLRDPRPVPRLTADQVARHHSQETTRMRPGELTSLSSSAAWLVVLRAAATPARRRAGLLPGHASRNASMTSAACRSPWRDAWRGGSDLTCRKRCRQGGRRTDGQLRCRRPARRYWRACCPNASGRLQAGSAGSPAAQQQVCGRRHL